MREEEKEMREVKVNPKRIAMYVIYDKDGILDNFRKYYLTELRKVCDTIVGVVSGTLTPESREELEELTDDFFVRENKGLLAGSWIDGIDHIGWDKLAEYDELLMLNDSFFGPFYPLSEMMDAAEKSDADFYGCMKNFEEKEYTQIAGRKLKHGHFRGSICYFYIIKERLLHSSEFKRYWSAMPDIKQDWDTYFYAEIDFYDYVRDAGFKIDAYQGDKLKGYFFDNLTHNMEKLVRDERIPFARIRPFCTDTKEQSIQIGYCEDPRRTLDYIDKYTDYDVNMIWDYILRTKNMSHIFNQLQLEYVVSRSCVEKTYAYDKPIAVILHIYYEDQIDILADYCKNFPARTDFYITTINENSENKIVEAFSKRGLHFQCQRRPNVGVAMSSLWVTYADIVTNGKYEYMCYFHDKKSPYTQFAIHGERFGIRCYENLFGSSAVVKNIINLFEDNPRMGVLGAPMVYHGEYFSAALRGWPGNYSNTVALAKRLDLHVNIDPNVMPVAPYGDMFWFRADALKKAVGAGLTYDDFDIKYEKDYTLMHAIERIYSFAAQSSGYYYADVINTDAARSDLVNYQYMLTHICNALFCNGYNTYCFPVTEQILRGIRSSSSKTTWRLKLKGKLEKVCPPGLWNLLKRAYHSLGGKKWVG